MNKSVYEWDKFSLETVLRILILEVYKSRLEKISE